MIHRFIATDLFRAFKRDGTRAYFQIQGIFHYFTAFKTEILHIYSLTGQIYIYIFIRSDKSTQELAWHIYYYLVSYRTTCAALIR